MLQSITWSPPVHRILLIATLTLAPALPAAAQDAQTTAAARALFEEGMGAVDRGEFVIAVDRLRRSLELRDSQVVRFNLALALLEVREYLEATEHLRLVQRRAEPDSELRRTAEERLAAAEARLGRLRVVIDGDTDGVTTQIDGHPMPDALVGVEQPSNPGVHQIAIFRGDRQLASTEATVETGRSTEVRLLARPPTESEESAMADGRAPFIEDEDSGGSVAEEWWFWTLIVAALVGAGVAVGVVLGTQDNAGAPTLRGDDGRVHETLLEVRF